MNIEQKVKKNKTAKDEQRKVNVSEARSKVKAFMATSQLYKRGNQNEIKDKIGLRFLCCRLK